MLDGCLAHFWTGASMKNGSNCFSSTDSPCRCLRVKMVYQGDCEEVRYYSYAMPIAHTQNHIQRRTLFPFKWLRFGSMSLCWVKNLSDKHSIKMPLCYKLISWKWKHVKEKSYSISRQAVVSKLLCHIFSNIISDGMGPFYLSCFRLTEWLGRWHWELRKMASHAHP